MNFDELQLLKTKPPRTYLGFGIQLKHYQQSGKFLHSLAEITKAPLEFLAEQLEIPD
ncbi:MAG: hypothetical protein L3J63_04505 [Geopsychrobacter sp.]|nr:hypothetical protein [Geopsychrobacter sp.]